MQKRPGLGVEVNYREVAVHPGNDIAGFILFEEGWEDREMGEKKVATRTRAQ